MEWDFLNIDRTSDVSIAEQIANQFLAAIIGGKISLSEKLPPERELADRLGISRGTVKRAYARLSEMHAIDMRHGSGSYILKNEQVLEENQKKEAGAIIASTFSRLNAIGLSEREIINLMNLYYLTSSSTNRLEKTSIMVVSNNHDILYELEQQLSYLTDASPFMFMLSFLTIDVITGNPDPIQMLLDYDLIIATTIDYPEIRKIAPMFSEKILEMAISPRSKTLVEISSLQKNSKVSVIYRTEIFRDMVIDSLELVGINKENIFPCYEYDYNPKSHSANGVSAIINFNESPVYINNTFEARNAEFLKKGGKIIRFEYQVKRSALVYIEDRIQQLLKHRFD